jgi:hypothetical protein
MKTPIVFTFTLLVMLTINSFAQMPVSGKFLLKDNWAIQSSKEIKSDAKAISAVGYKTDGDDKADFTDLSKLPAANINVTASAIQQEGNKCRLTVTIENQGAGLARKREYCR